MRAYDDYLLYYASKLGRKSFIIKKGEGRVMLSAPHAAEQTRNGHKKYGEFLTGVLANMLHDSTLCPIIVKEKNCGDDANRDEKCKYKAKLVKFAEKNGIEYLIDLHQMNPERDELIDIGTGEGKNIAAEPDIAERVKARFEAAGLSGVLIDGRFTAVHPFTVSAYTARECGIACLQIEFNTRLLSKRYKECRYDDVMRTMESIIKDLNGGCL